MFHLKLEEYYMDVSCASQSIGSNIEQNVVSSDEH